MPPELNKTDVNFSAFLMARLKERGMSVRKLSEVSGISMEHLTALTQGEMGSLPPAPYLHGYIVKLGQILGFDPAEWWEILRRASGVRRSGMSDAMAKNRFVRKSYRRLVIGGVGLIVVLIYAFVRFSNILGVPDIIVSDPADGGATAISDVYILRGTTHLADSVFVNGEAADISSDGQWQKRVVLESGQNTFEIRAQKMLGRSATVVRHVTFNPEPTSTRAVVLPEPTNSTSSTSTNAVQ